MTSYGLFISTILILCIPSLLLLAGNDNSGEPVPVNQVDLQRYTGLWYEIARIPNRFQKQCGGSVTAEYQLRDDGKISVTNRCKTTKGEIDQAEGIAKVVDSQTNSRLKVSFVNILGLSLFWGDYWIIGLDEEYQWAIVGTPNRKYGWILARQTQLDPEILEHIHQLLRLQGYNPQDFAMTAQQEPSTNDTP